MLFFARRGLIAASIAASISTPPPTFAEVATSPFEWSGLWRGVEADPEPKRTGLAASELAKILEADLAQRKYILTGDITTTIFSESCRFVDPNNAVEGLNKYRQALSLLFEPDASTVTDVVVSVGADGRSVQADYTARGVLKLPWHPVIEPWRGHIVYVLNADNLIASQVDVWNITRFDAIRQSFTPGR